MLSTLTEQVRFPATWTARAVRVRGHERHVAAQAVKSSLAAVLAWLVAAEWLTLPQAFLAPYVAVFLVETTVFRSVRQAVVQMGTVVAGVLLAAAAAWLVPERTTAIGLVVLVGWFVGRWRRFGSNGIWVAITALLVVSTGAANSPVMLGERLLETAIGAACGLLVTAAVFPPVYPVGDELGALSREMRALLRDMAAGWGGTAGRDAADWVRRADDIDRFMQRATDSTQWARESTRLNPRPSAARVRDQARRSDGTLDGLRRVASPLQELARAAQAATEDPIADPDGRLRRAASSLLDSLADLVDRVGDPGGDTGVETAADDCEARLAALEQLAAESSDPRAAAMLGGLWQPARRLLAGVRATTVRAR